VLNLSEQELQQVARHMGHELAVHWQYYHLQDDVVELAKVSKLLIAVKQGKAHRDLQDGHWMTLTCQVEAFLLSPFPLYHIKICVSLSLISAW